MNKVEEMLHKYKINNLSKLEILLNKYSFEQEDSTSLPSIEVKQGKARGICLELDNGLFVKFTTE